MNFPFAVPPTLRLDGNGISFRRHVIFFACEVLNVAMRFLYARRRNGVFREELVEEGIQFWNFFFTTEFNYPMDRSKKANYHRYNYQVVTAILPYLRKKNCFEITKAYSVHLLTLRVRDTTMETSRKSLQVKRKPETPKETRIKIDKRIERMGFFV